MLGIYDHLAKEVEVRTKRLVPPYECSRRFQVHPHDHTGTELDPNNFSGISRLFGGEEAILAMATVCLFKGGR